MRLPFTVIAALFAAVMGPAQEKPAAQPAPAEDAITATKRDFDSIKATPESATQTKSDLSRFGLPELHVSPGEFRPRNPPKALTPEKKSANWLVDAMQKKSDLRTDLRKEQPGGREAEHSLLDGQEADDAAQGEPKRSTTRAEAEAMFQRERKEIDPTLNPLNRFLSDWMTPQDYALLKPGLQGSRAGESSGPRSEAPVSPFAGELSGIVTPDITTGMAGTNKPAFVAPTPQENPYLQIFSVPTSLPSTPVSPITPATSPRINAPVTSVPTGTPAPGRIPDFAKPATDDKYFKPLKRF